jgi:hypothetical protein
LGHQPLRELHQQSEAGLSPPDYLILDYLILDWQLMDYLILDWQLLGWLMLGWLMLGWLMLGWLMLGWRKSVLWLVRLQGSSLENQTELQRQESQARSLGSQWSALKSTRLCQGPTNRGPNRQGSQKQAS